MPTRGKLRRHSPAPPSESLRGLGERVRRARVEAGLSQSQLGAPHFTRAYVSALELGKVRPAMASLEFLAGKLGKPVTFFVEDEVKERQRQERGSAIARANQLIAEGEASRAVAELADLALDDLSLGERLGVKLVLGHAYLEARELRRAMTVLSEALQGYASMRNKAQIARTHLLLGRVLVAELNYAEAESHLQSALSASVSGIVRDPLFRVHVLYNLGVVQYGRGSYGRALEYLDRAAAEGGDIGDARWLASVHAAIGMSRREVRDYEGAITEFLRSEALFDQLRNRDRVATLKFETGRALRAIGNRMRADEVLAAAIEAATDAGAESLAIRIEAFIANAIAEDGDPATARSRLEGLLDRADGCEDPLAALTVRMAFARLIASNDERGAENVLLDLVKILKTRGAADDLEAVYDLLGKILDAQGRSQEALRYAQLAYEMSQRGKGVPG